MCRIGSRVTKFRLWWYWVQCVVRCVVFHSSIKTDERTCNDSDIIQFVKSVCKIHVMVTWYMICKCTWQILRCTSLKQLFSRCRLQTLQYGKSRHRLQSPSLGLRTPQLVHEVPMRHHMWWIRITTHNHVRSRDNVYVELLKLNKNTYVIKNENNIIVLEPQV